MKKCPFCAEEIQEEAVKCKHCMEFLDESKRPVSTYPTGPVPAYPPGSIPPALPGSGNGKSAEGIPWFCRTSFIVLTFAMIPPLAIPLIWLRPKLHWGWKLGHSVAILLVTWGMVASFRAIFLKYQEVIEMMNGMGGMNF